MTYGNPERRGCRPSGGSPVHPTTLPRVVKVPTS
jgi:hypothetical protein